MVSVRFNDDFVRVMSKVAEMEGRTTPKQIEHFAKIGMLMESNRDLTYSEIEERLAVSGDLKNAKPRAFENVTWLTIIK